MSYVLLNIFALSCIVWRNLTHSILWIRIVITGHVSISEGKEKKEPKGSQTEGKFDMLKVKGRLERSLHGVTIYLIQENPCLIGSPPVKSRFSPWKLRMPAQLVERRKSSTAGQESSAGVEQPLASSSLGLHLITCRA